MYLANHDLWLPNMVSKQANDKQTENRSKSNGKKNVRPKAIRDTMLRNQKRTKIIDIIEYTLKQKWKWEVI